MKDFKISEHFTFFELTNSKDHPDLIETNREYFSIQPYIGRLTVACEYLLETMRGDLNIPIYVLNGGRYPELNSAVGGVSNSQHLFGNLSDGAFDITTPAMAISELGDYIAERSSLCWHQLRIYLKQNFVHIGMPRGNKDGQVAIIK
jgi:hypothetical protein